MMKLIASVLSLTFFAAMIAACTPSSTPVPETARDYRDSAR